MKLGLRTGILCSCLWIAPVFAQDTGSQPQQPQPATQQPPSTQPTAAQQPPTTPPATPPQVPPPGGINPTAPIPKPEVTLPPEKTAPPTQPHERDTGNDLWSIEPIYWLTHHAPSTSAGHTNVDPDPADLGFPERSKESLGIAITVPTGHEYSLEFTGFEVKGQGNSFLYQTKAFFGNLYAIHDTLATGWYVKSYKVSWNYLMYPYPSNGAKIRYKALFELQDIMASAHFDAPGDINAAPVVGSKSILRPLVGAGVELHPVSHVRFEVKASGIAFPHHGDIYGGEASLAIRVWKVEVLGGGRYLHYKTSPGTDAFFSQTMWGPYGGLRLIWK